MGISTHVEVNLVVDSGGLAFAGFGVPMIASASASWPERTRTYTSIAGVADDFATSSPEYLEAQAIFAQSPHPTSIVIGRCANKPTKKLTLTVATVANAYTYKLNVKGEGVTATQVEYLSDSGATGAEVHSGMLTALNAVVGKNYTAAFAALVYADQVFTAANATEIFTKATHGLLTGDGPFQVSNSGGALPAGLVAATDYWVIKIDANTFYLATSLANALAGTHLSITTDGTGTQTISDTGSTVRPNDAITLTGTSAGAWFSVEVLNEAEHDSPDDWAMESTHADPGIAADLTAIYLANPDWYCLLTHFNSDAYVKAAAAWVQANGRIYPVVSSDTAGITVAADGTQGTLDDLKTLGYTRVAGMYHHAPDQMAAAAWAGRVLPIDPGGIVWAYKPLAGVAASRLTETQKANLDARNASYYKTEGGASFTWKGKASGGQYFDIVRDLDWYEDVLQKEVLALFLAKDKVPATKPGARLIAAKIRGATEFAIRRGVLSDDPKPVYTFPDPNDRSDIDKANRNYPDMKVDATLANAILTVSMNITVAQ